jgi:Leucine-rich repeat (LRR) protein
MERSRIIVTFLSFSFAALCQAQTKVVLSYTYPTGVMTKEVAAEKTEITIAYDHDLQAISGLENLRQLRSVTLIALDSLTELSALLYIANLEVIVLDAMIAIRDIDSLFAISTLKSIIIRSCPGLADERSISIDLRNLPRIKYLQIADSGLRSPPVISSIPKSLQYLNLSGNRLTSFDPFEGIPTRVKIYLFGNPIKGKPKTSNIVMDIERFIYEVPVEYQATY